MVDPSCVESFVGKNPEYYVDRWAPMADGTNSRVR